MQNGAGWVWLSHTALAKTRYQIGPFYSEPYPAFYLTAHLKFWLTLNNIKHKHKCGTDNEQKNVISYESYNIIRGSSNTAHMSTIKKFNRFVTFFLSLFFIIFLLPIHQARWGKTKCTLNISSADRACCTIQNHKRGNIISILLGGEVELTRVTCQRV